MTYANLLSDESVQSRYFAIIKPKRKAASFTLFSGSVYSQSFNYGIVYSVSIDGVQLTLGSSSSLSAGEFYWDRLTNILYVRTSDSTTPNDNFVVITYELYFTSHGSGDYWYRTPTSSITETVFYEPLIEKSPTIKQTVSDVLFGIQPQQSSSLKLINAEHIFEKHIYDSSFYKSSIQLYHALLERKFDQNITKFELNTTNIRFVLDGFCTDYSYEDGTISLKITDRTNSFDKDYRNIDPAENFYTSSTFSNVDPSFIGKPIRYAYGFIEGWIPVNIDYNSDAPTTSNNRVWVALGEQNNINELTRNVVASPVSTDTRTYVNDANGFVIGDSVWFDRAVGTDEYEIITNVNYASDYIEHSALVGGAMVSGDAIKRSFIGNITIVQDNVKYQALYGRDYNPSLALAGGTTGFTFTSSLESNLSMPSTLSPNDKIYCRLYGRKTDTTISASPFGTDDLNTRNMTSPIVILYDLLKRSGISESQIDTAGFQSLESTNTEAIAVGIPSESSDSNFPDLKSIIIDIMKTSLVRMYVNNDNKWTVSRLAPIVSTTKTIGDDEILDGSFDYSFNYSDVVSDITVEYAFREVSDDLSQSGSITSKVTATSETAQYLHGISKLLNFKSLHFRSTDAIILADRLSFIFGDREGLVNIQSTKRFFDNLLNDKITIQRTKLPGFDFDRDTLQDRNFAITEFQKDLNRVNLLLNDQKGIQDNSGSW